MAVKPQFFARVGRVPQIILGLLLVTVWWPIAWTQFRPSSDYYFFPLWLGFILTIDGIVRLRTDTSLWTRDRGRFLLLFVCSVPFWWIFEWMNRYLGDWHYVAPSDYSTFWYVVLASIAFSTVVPAVLEATELLASLRVGERLPNLPAWRLSTRDILAFELLGWIMLALVILFPRYAFPLAWLSIFFIVEPINAYGGQRSIGNFVRQGNWQSLWNLMLATVFTGFFWEMWNYFSMPKWTYSVPFVGFAHLFEMPLLGYTGYLPFGLEVFSMFGIIFLIVFRSPQHYAVLSSVDADEVTTGSSTT
ncbi:MAG: hypothetical protein WBW04_00740 [Nitrolancea sp.]